MGQSAKALLQLAVILGTFATVLFWAVPEHPGDVVWAFRLGLPAILLLICWMLVRNAKRPEILPDHLMEISGKYLERDGLCFAPVLDVVDGVCWLNVHFQNRYARPCTTQIVMLPGGTTFSVARLNVINVNVEFDCDGGAFGILRFPLAIPTAYQGKAIRYKVAAKTRYPHGRGRLLRYRGGAGVGPIRVAGAEQMLEAFSEFSLSSAGVELILPHGVAEQLPDGVEPNTETLWAPDTALLART